MTTYTREQFADRYGVKSPTLAYWARKGWIVFTEDRRVEVEKSDALLALHRDVKSAQAMNARKGKPPTLPAEILPAIQVVEEARKLGELVIESAAMGLDSPAVAPENLPDPSEGKLSTEDARRVKENYLALSQKLKYEKDNKSLIDFDLAKTMFFESAREMREAWIRWPADVGPLVAADLGIESDKVVEILNAHVHRHLARLGTPEMKNP